MTQKERLLYLLFNSPFPKDIVQYSRSDAIECDFHISDIESFADYLLNNGVIVPPCKVGDTVYKIAYAPCTKQYSSLCDGCMAPCGSQPTITTYVAPTNTWIVREFIDNVKQHYYLTHEAAEKVLKERDNE